MESTTALLSSTKMDAQLHIIIGCMYSGKSTELLKVINYYKILEKPLYIINHELDTRYGSGIISHDKKSCPSHSLSSLMSIKDNTEFLESDVVIIEEAQFFEDLIEFVKLCLSINKIIYVAGLDGDSFMKPFGKILELIPLCDSIKKLSALCVLCKNGTPANFTRRIVDNQEQKLIGSFESFIPVCRKHHNSD